MLHLIQQIIKKNCVSILYFKFYAPDFFSLNFLIFVRMICGCLPVVTWGLKQKRIFFFIWLLSSMLPHAECSVKNF